MKVHMLYVLLNVQLLICEGADHINCIYCNTRNVFILLTQYNYKFR